jgi:hypothetical protein
MKRGRVVLVATVFGVGLLLAPTVTRIVLTIVAATTLIAGAFCMTAAFGRPCDGGFASSWSTRARQLLTAGFVMGVGATVSGLVAATG